MHKISNDSLVLSNLSESGSLEVKQWNYQYKWLCHQSFLRGSVWKCLNKQKRKSCLYRKGLSQGFSLKQIPIAASRCSFMLHEKYKILTFF